MNSISTPGTFIHLFCRKDQCLTPHRAGRVLSQQWPMVKLELYCRRCGTKVLYETDELPASHRTYRVRITGESNPDLPAEFCSEEASFLEEEITVVAGSTQEAHETADFATSLRFSGHLVRHWVDGELHLDERF